MTFNEQLVPHSRMAWECVATLARIRGVSERLTAGGGLQGRGGQTTISKESPGVTCL
jgi:hypothetical protein